MQGSVLILFLTTLMSIGNVLARSVPPVAEFSFSPANPNAGAEVTFTAVGAYDPDGTIQFFGWDFGDDGVIEEVGVQVRYAFQTPGKYNIRLIVIDNEGLSSSAVKTINVSEPMKQKRDYSPFRLRFGLGNTFVTRVNDRTYWEMFSPYGILTINLLTINLLEIGLRMRYTDLGAWLDSWLYARVFSLSVMGVGNTEISIGLAMWGILVLYDPFEFLSFSIKQYLGHNFAIGLHFGYSLPMKINDWQVPFGFSWFWMLNLEFIF